MKRVVIFLLMSIAFFYSGRADTLGGLLDRFNQRIGEPDSAYAFMSNTAKMNFIDMAQDKIVRIGNFLQRRVDVTFSRDSLKYALPVNFKKVTGVTVWGTDSVWYQVAMNQNFATETDLFQFFIAWANPDTAEIYLKGKQFYDGMTVRVFYLATAASLDTVTDTCEVPDDLEVYIIEEAMSFYRQAMTDYGTAQAIYQQVRLDLGVLQPQQGKQ
jgi:hypothetical protein